MLAGNDIKIHEIFVIISMVIDVAYWIIQADGYGWIPFPLFQWPKFIIQIAVMIHQCTSIDQLYPGE